MMFTKNKDSSPLCPLINKACIKDKCNFWTHVQGQNPQNAQPIDHYDCAVKWIPMLLIENSQQQRQTGAAVESLRNENVTTGQQITGALLQVANAAPKEMLEGKQ